MRRLHAVMESSLWPLLVALAWLAFGLALLSGCSAAGDGGPEPLPPPVLTPEPELEASTRSVAERYYAATGLTIEVRDGGAPVYVDTGLDACGTTYTAFRRWKWESTLGVAINLGHKRCTTELHTLTHELGHVLCSQGSGPEESCHSLNPHAVMFENANSTEKIDYDSLEVICRFAQCRWFQPEE